MSLEEFYHFAKERNLKFDIITLFQVLEHQDRPREFLEMVKDLLKKGGYIAGSVPNRKSDFQQDLNQKINPGVDHPPHHVLRFSKEALEKSLEISGFKNVEVYKCNFLKEELPAYIEKKLIRKRVTKLKVYLKGKIFGNKKLADAVAVEDIYYISQSLSAKILKLLKKSRNFILLLFTLFYLLKLKGNGKKLYFQTKLKT
jgi:SAM-dependent methyltransferase